MITAGENYVLKMIAVGGDGYIMPPCGWGKFTSQLHKENLITQIIVNEVII